MTIRAIYSLSLDGDSWLAYSCKAICADVPAAVRWIRDNPLTPEPRSDGSIHAAHPLMTAANGWAFFGTRAEVEALDAQLKGGDFGYVVEETEVAK